jgi:SAM-dependent methyltransferase
MPHKASRLPTAAAVLLVVGASLALAAGSQRPTPPVPVRRPDVMWIPTGDRAVTAMLKLAGVTKADVVYDLGCGDGRIVIAAARQFGARGVGIEIDPEQVAAARAAVRAAGVADKVTILEGDIFDSGLRISDATVVTLFLLQSLNEKLRPRLQAELKPGTRIVSHAFHMGAAWPPERSETVGDTTIYLWTIGKSEVRGRK